MTTFAILDADLERQEFTPNPDPATGARQQSLIDGQATIGTRGYDWANIVTVAVGATSAASVAVGAAGEYELSADVDCYVLVGSDPTATTSSRYLPAGGAFTLQLGATDKVAAIRKDVDGTLTILPVA